MFWLDASEENGTIYLTGKVAVSAQGTGDAGDQAAGPTTFVSACVAVHGIEREVLVLPRCGRGVPRPFGGMLAARPPSSSSPSCTGID